MLSNRSPIGPGVLFVGASVRRAPSGAAEHAPDIGARPTRLWRGTLAAVVLALLSVSGSAVAQAQPSAPEKSTVDGVYTRAQAQQGADVYAGMCQSCHTAASHTGPPFRNKWVGRPLSELFDFIVDQMPKTEPGSLTMEQYTVVLAYMLRMNGMPAGRAKLSANEALLRSIRIELPTGEASSGERH